LKESDNNRITIIRGGILWIEA